jgi:quercetin dioxygenase-like cupin family protein
MRVEGERVGELLVTTYHLDAGEKIDWHSHPVPHTTRVDDGCSRVDVGDDLSFEMRPGEADYELPANTKHRVTAVENGTICVHTIERMQSGDPLPVGADGKYHANGGVMLDTGEVVYDD